MRWTLTRRRGREKTKKAPVETGAFELEREKGFESPAFRVVSDTYATPDGDGRGSTRSLDASGRVATDLDASDAEAVSALPALSPDLFITAGALAANHAAQSRWARSRIEELLRRAVDQAAALRGEDA
jgi:hypothetical protein